MKKDKTKVFIIFYVVFFCGVIIDYKLFKIIPNFVFLNNFNEQYIIPYWKGVFSLFIAYGTLTTIYYTARNYHLNKDNFHYTQNNETLIRYQDLLEKAIKIFREEPDDENKCLFAVQIVKNIINLYDDLYRKESTNCKIDPTNILSLQGLLIILKSHLDYILSQKNNNKKRRADIELIFNILYGRKYDFIEKSRKDLKLYEFSNLNVNVLYFEELILADAKFDNIYFYDSEKNDFRLYSLVISQYTEFKNCEFDAKVRMIIEENSSIVIKNCKFREIEILSLGNYYHIPEKNGVSNVIIEKSVFNDFANFSDNKFGTFKINECKFANTLHMQRVEINNEFSVKDSLFEGIFDLQSSLIKWKIEFENVICNKLFFFWDSKFLNKERIIFNDFYIKTKNDFPKANFNALICENIDDINSTPKYFDMLYKLVYLEDKKIYSLQSLED